MLIDQELAELIINSFSELSKDIAIKAHKYLGTHNSITGYCRYPVLQPQIECDDPETQKIIDEIPYIKHKIPRYELKDFPKERIHYHAIFDGYSNDKINIIDEEKFKDLYEKIISNEKLKLCFFGDDKTSEYTIKNIIIDIVTRYLYATNATQEIPSDIDELLEKIILQKMWRYIGDSLKIDICVPLCLITFEEDSIQLSETIEIVRIPEEIQKSRKQSCQYETQNEDSIASCATHMIVLHGYHFENNEFLSINYVTRNYNAYPLDEIDCILAIIRIVTGYTCGYEQLLTQPLGWLDSTFEDLQPLYGAKSHFINPRETEKHWMQLNVSFVNTSQIKIIRDLYSSLNTIKNAEKNDKLLFSLKRLNRCMLRNDNDDMAIDATIGLESLLAGGTMGEITYTISNRIPIVFSIEQDTRYSPNECRNLMKKIYGYRSGVVHGRKLKDSEKYYEVQGKKTEIEQIAVDFLRQALLFILKNPAFLDVKKFDEYIDEAVTRA